MKKKRKGACINCWKMSTHRKIVSQRKLYDYLADRSAIIESQLFSHDYRNNLDSLDDDIVQEQKK